MALALLQAQGGGVPPAPNCEFVGELSLDGALRPVAGALPALEAAAAAHRLLVLPVGNGTEAGLFSAPQGRLAPSLSAVLAWLKGKGSLPRPVPSEAPPPEEWPTLSRVQGQVLAKRALALAAVGGHNLLMVGPPGSGKTLIAESLPGLLPPLSDQTAREVAMVQSLSQREGLRHRPRRPFSGTPPFHFPGGPHWWRCGGYAWGGLPWLMGACYSLMSCQSSPGPRSRRCASPWKLAKWRCLGPVVVRAIQPVSSCWRR